MLELHIDGQKVEVEAGSTVMDAARKIGKHIPHFCYHKKLSIAANCRMCLVDVEKMPKAVPACATPVSADMKVSTNSEKAIKAQKSVMEFLLINHPLDCPICDQGGECQLQDIAVGYGVSQSRYQEEKRVVFNKNLGPLVNTDMTRCIHCSRCVRFGQEISGVMELGIANRGEHSEVMTFVDRSLDSELSGNAIDLCPVGALTSKPFRFAARSWEMTRRFSVSPHDSLGSNLQVQVKGDKVVRVLPFENEDVNECWLSDRDRFSYEGLSAADRLTHPKIKHGGEWHTVDWETALDYVVRTLRDVKDTHGAEQLAALVSPLCTLEEMYLTQKVMRGMGSGNVDARLRHQDFSLDGKRSGVPWLGMPVRALSTLDSVLVVGSVLRKDHPLLAQRLRQAQKRGGHIARVNATRDEWLIPLSAELITPPDAMVFSLASVVSSLCAKTGVAVAAECAHLIAGVEAEAAAHALADSLLHGEKRAVLIGNFALHHPDSSSLQVLAAEIARLSGATFGFLGDSGAFVSAHLIRPAHQAGLNAKSMLESPRKAYVLVGVEPELDCANGAVALNALKQAASVIYLGSFVGKAAEFADVMLPISPFTETSGTFVNIEGRAQSFQAVAKPFENTRPAWKVLRVLGNLLGLDGFDYESSEQVRDEVLPADISSVLNNGIAGFVPQPSRRAEGGQRIADVAIYATDPLVRRATALQKTRDALPPRLRVSPSMLAVLGVEEGGSVKVSSDTGEIRLSAHADSAIPEGCYGLSAGHPTTAPIGAMFGALKVERA
jgi:NADH-quinone oxidoreductase subunit G